MDLGGRSHKQRRIGAVIYQGHVRARTLPDDPALDDLRTDWGEVEYVPASALEGAVDLLRWALPYVPEPTHDMGSCEYVENYARALQLTTRRGQ
jgi:hypothetical protein